MSELYICRGFKALYVEGYWTIFSNEGSFFRGSVPTIFAVELFSLAASVAAR